MDKSRLRRDVKEGPPAGIDITKMNSNCYQNVAFAGRPISMACSRPSNGTQTEGSILRVSSLSHRGGTEGNAEILQERCQLLKGTSVVDPATDIHEGAL